jgi:hypothetical protein
MTNRFMARLLSLPLLAVLAGCVMPPQSGTTIQTTTTMVGIPLGSLTPVYNPPPGTPFHCTYVGDEEPMFSIPGDIGHNGIGLAESPVATMGNRRGDWLLIVTRTGVIGWVEQPHEIPISQSPNHWIEYCHVHQDAQGRIVFNWKGAHGEF